MVTTADLVVIGGGINGSGIACDAQGRGLDVVLCEAKDFASGTSWASSKLVHGGLRYLEQYEFKMVREALREREVLLNKAPHLIQPLKFVLPHHQHLRSQWMIRAGIFLYDFLAGKMKLEKSRKLDLTKQPEGLALKTDFKTGFSYSDCRIDDARMVLANIKHAESLGARVYPQTECVSAKRHKSYWVVTMRQPQREEFTVHAKGIVNAGGPWVAQMLHHVLESDSASDVRLIKGSHIVVPRLYEGDHAYILQNKDNRIVFTIPYGFVDQHTNQYTLIGTTDVNYQGDPRDVSISEYEKDYLCDVVNEYFKNPITKASIIWSYAGVRPLYADQSDDPSKNTREYQFELENAYGELPVLSVFGGKVTTFRTLSEKAMNRLKPYFDQMGGDWTANVKTPGGDADSLSELLNDIKRKYPWLEPHHAYRLAVSYGSETNQVLGKASAYYELGEHIGHDFYEQELAYMVQHEHAYDTHGVLWLRSKLGLWLDEKAKNRVAELIEYYRSL